MQPAPPPRSMSRTVCQGSQPGSSDHSKDRLCPLAQWTPVTGCLNRRLHARHSPLWKEGWLCKLETLCCRHALSWPAPCWAPGCCILAMHHYVCTGPGCLRWEHLGFDGLSMQDSSWMDLHVLLPLPVFPFVWTDRVICCDDGRQSRHHARSLKGSPYSCCPNHQRSPSKGAPALNRVCS